jgi:hypothetical protein
MKHRCSYDGITVQLVEIIGNTTLLMTDTESAPSGAEPAPSGAEGDFDASGDAVSGTEDGEEVASHETTTNVLLILPRWRSLI